MFSFWVVVRGVSLAVLADFVVLSAKINVVRTRRMQSKIVFFMFVAVYLKYFEYRLSNYDEELTYIWGLYVFFRRTGLVWVGE